MNLVNRLKATITPSVKTVEEQATNDDIIEFSEDNATITRDVAEKIGALNYGVALISETIASLPVYLYKRDENGGRERINDYRNKLLNLENSPYSTAYNMKQNLVSDYLYHGNGYLDINRQQDLTIESLIHIPYREITINKSEQINRRETRYSYDYWGMVKIPAHDVLNLSRNTKSGELEGHGILREGSMILGNSYGFEQYTETTIQSGFNVKGVIEKDGTITKPSRDSLMEMLRKFFSGKRNAGKVMILDDGMKFKSISMSPADLELLQQKEFTIKDIARLLKIQPSLLGIAKDSMTYSNEKDNQLQFLKYTIEPLLTIIEQTFNKYLLTEDEKDKGYFFEFNTQNMLRTSPEDEIKMYAEAVRGSILTADEARQRLNWKPLGLGKLLIPLSHGFINSDGTITSHKSEITVATEESADGLKGGEEDEN